MQEFLGTQHLKKFSVPLLIHLFLPPIRIDEGGAGDGSNRRDFNEITELKGSGLLVYENQLG